MRRLAALPGIAAHFSSAPSPGWVIPAANLSRIRNSGLPRLDSAAIHGRSFSELRAWLSAWGFKYFSPVFQKRME
jgi:hypothetical protein